MTAVLPRTQKQLEAQLSIATADLASLPASAAGETRAYYGAAVDAISWLLGRTNWAPATGAHVPAPMAADIAAERQAAEDAVYGRRPAGDRPSSWYNAVSQILGWALSDSTPTAFQPGAQLRARADIEAERSTLLARRAAAKLPASDQETLAGALAAAAWLLGEGPAPLSGIPAVAGGPTGPQVDDEAERSNERRYADDAGRDPQWSFVYGVDRFLDWALDDANVASL